MIFTKNKFIILGNTKLYPDYIIKIINLFTKHIYDYN